MIVANELKEEQEKLKLNQLKAEPEESKRVEDDSKQSKRTSLLLNLRDDGLESLPRVLKIVNDCNGQVRFLIRFKSSLECEKISNDIVGVSFGIA